MLANNFIGDVLAFLFGGGAMVVTISLLASSKRRLQDDAADGAHAQTKRERLNGKVPAGNYCTRVSPPSEENRAARTRVKDS